MKKPIVLLLAVPLLAFAVTLGVSAVTANSGTAPAAVATSDTDPEVEKLSRQYISWYEEIELTPEQEEIKRAALEPLPAPCCSDNSAYTCCCPCNLSRALWGMTAHMIAKEGKNAEEVQDAAKKWIARINPGPSSGDACYTGRCGLPYSKDGCGGMNPAAQNYG